ncbi:hypothetical protein MAA_10561 [Metarhizium robertsii ARSEF 23]|uniref:Uncharacterized protein n=1 Tax=Metarhizium robertsii (strain ARSEF 23 / ATCC MYA-3075) TaxID=655844 RepID=E9FE62_METRA|nr:uncharacterized protein MAA_10561 [Metarhizium robertsii ARSEF 23]EFY93978.2 hypothetical protein MAA_10561 [Metarhizium robertsii ARSEF 23]
MSGGRRLQRETLLLADWEAETLLLADWEAGGPRGRHRRLGGRERSWPLEYR